MQENLDPELVLEYKKKLTPSELDGKVSFAPACHLDLDNCALVHERQRSRHFGRAK